MKILGNVNFNNNESLNFVSESYDGSIDPANPFPSNPVVGRFVYRTDTTQFYICISTNPVVWQPLIKVADTFTFTQSTVATTWTINHNLGTQDIIVQVYDNNQNRVIPDEIVLVDNNSITISFDPSMAGKAEIIAINASMGTFVDKNKLSQDVLKSDLDITSVTYDANDNPTLVQYGDGSYATLTYISGGAADGKVQVIKFKNSSNVIIENWSYGYDTNGRLVTATKTT